MRGFIGVVLMVCAVACEPSPDEISSPKIEAGAEMVEVVEITDLAGQQSMELVLTDDVVYLIAPGVPRERLWIGERTLASIVGDTVGPEEMLVIGTDIAMDLYEGTPGAGMWRKPGCWWVWDGSQWVRYCLA